MDRHEAAAAVVTDILERFPDTRSDPLEVLRRVYYTFAHRPKISRTQIDTAINTIQAFNLAGVNMETHLRALRKVQHSTRPDLDDPNRAAERDDLAEEYRSFYSPYKDEIDPEQTTLF